MDGRWDLGRRSRAPEWQRRVEIEFETGWLTAVDVPVLGVVATAHEELVVGHLGPDLCGPEIPDIDAIVARLARVSERPLAGALLDQRNVAGFGNVYAVEVPFIAGVSPFQPIGTIERLDLVVRAGSALIRTNAERGPQNTTGRRLHEAHHWVYGRRRRPCPWCSAPLAGMSERDSPWQRTTTWCPSCQELTDRRTVDPARIERALILHPARKRYPTDVG
jgi:endonuclease-8